jgi:branched-chain amino acid transport system substrate-binding protein
MQPTIARLLKFAFLICYTACTVNSSFSQDQAEDERALAPASTIKIGAILPLSGGASNFGAIARRGIELALEDLTPNDRKRVKVIFEDDGLSNAKSATAARKLLSVDKVDAILTWSSGTGITVASIAEAKKIPHISVATDPAVAKGREYSFTYWAIAEDEARTLKDYLLKTGIRRIAILSQVHNGILAIRDAFMRELDSAGPITIVASEEATGDITDFRAVLQRIKLAGEIDAFMPIFFPGQLALCIRQARALGINSQLLGFETFEDKDEIKAAAGLMSGAIYATSGDPQTEFVSRYERSYPGESLYTANQTYDIIRMFVEASRNSKSADAIISYLKGFKDKTAASGQVSISSNNQFRLPTTVKRIGADGVPRNILSDEITH